eukprot:2798724-Amphidinium_carterae.3
MTKEFGVSIPMRCYPVRKAQNHVWCAADVTLRLHGISNTCSTAALVLALSKGTGIWMPPPHTLSEKAPSLLAVVARRWAPPNIRLDLSLLI